MAELRTCPKCHLKEPDTWWISSSGEWCGPCVEQLRQAEWEKKQAARDRYWWMTTHDERPPEDGAEKRYVVRRRKE
jgi:hypothetical protein